MQAKGTFDIDMQPQQGAIPVDNSGMQFGRMSFRKTFLGDLQGTSFGELLSARSAVQGSAGYVAIEQVSATLDGRRGTFTLQHFGTQSANQSELKLEVVPDSGSGELTGLSGLMVISKENGQHFYAFGYELATKVES